jgi:hypothetical protein
MDEQNVEPNTPHYYGNVVRALFVAAALIMLVGLPALTAYLSVSTPISVVGMLVLGLSAGLTNPKQIWVAVVNACIAIVGFMVFESYAVSSYQIFGSTSKFFITNLVLSFIFILAVYFSVKTLRGLWLNRQ